MDVLEAVRSRKSIRAFKAAPVPQTVLKQVMELALRAPSWSNTQPWQFAVATGKKLEAIKKAFIEKAGEEPTPDLPRPRGFPEPYDSRRRSIGRKTLETRGIGREDTEKRRWWQLQGLGLFGAPAAIYIYIDRSFHFQDDGLNVWPVFDCGLVAENIMLLATEYGLGTIPQIQAVHYPDVLRKTLGISDAKLMVLGIAIGYPNWDDPINRFRSERESLDAVVKWHGFD